MKQILVIIVLCMSCLGYSQEDKELRLAQKKANNHVYEANELVEEDFVVAEMEYRKALSNQSDNIAGLYNLGNSYYNNGSFDEALYRHQQTVNLATSKSEKHKAFHNIGNILMKNKNCKEAVEAYKNALRNNPSDDETRYNLILAKECAKQQENENKEDKDNSEEQKDENKENQDNKNNQENQENQDQDKKDNKDQADQDKGEEDEKGEDKEDEGKDGKNDEEKNSEEDKEDKSEGEENDKNKEEDEKRKKDGDVDNENKDGQRKEGQQQLSPQQIRSLLEAMNNQEQKVQEKIKGELIKEGKGQRVNVEKDW